MIDQHALHVRVSIFTSAAISLPYDNKISEINFTPKEMRGKEH